jgi:hydroxypyruvate reductase
LLAGLEGHAMKPLILTAMPLAKRLTARLAERYIVAGPLERSAPDCVPEAAREARALITLGGLKTDAALMDALPLLGLIACYGTGFENVDRATAAARGIVVTHAKDANAASVADFAMGLVLASARDIVRADRFVRAGGWTSHTIARMPLVPGVGGKRLGIYGLGAIGGKIATRAAAFDMEVGYHGRTRRPDLPYLYHPTLIGLAEWADILVVAARAGAENRGAINREVLKALGREGHLVNIARGVIVDETALAEALETGVIAGAALDVYENEPNVPDRLKALDNIVLTPHMAALSIAAQEAQQQLMLDNLEAFFAGRPVLTPVA